MTPAPNDRKPLLVLVADLDIENAVLGLLSRHQSLGIRELKDFDIHRHPNRDGGCRSGAELFLAPSSGLYDRVMVIFDHEGCGEEKRTREEIEADLEKRLSETGWGDRNAVVCIKPELEAWVWSTSAQVAMKLGWNKQPTKLRDWLVNKGFIACNAIKPEQPKEALEAVLREVGRSRSASIYKELAESVSLNKCTDPAFGKFKSTLQKWFPVQHPIIHA